MIVAAVLQQKPSKITVYVTRMSHKDLILFSAGKTRALAFHIGAGLREWVLNE
jgi:hypothetical protein